MFMVWLYECTHEKRNTAHIRYKFLKKNTDTHQSGIGGSTRTRLPNHTYTVYKIPDAFMTSWVCKSYACSVGGTPSVCVCVCAHVYACTINNRTNITRLTVIGRCSVINYANMTTGAALLVIVAHSAARSIFQSAGHTLVYIQRKSIQSIRRLLCKTHRTDRARTKPSALGAGNSISIIKFAFISGAKPGARCFADSGLAVHIIWRFDVFMVCLF